MTTPTFRDLLRLAGPMYIAQLATMANGLIDTVMAGRLSSLDLAAVGVATSIQSTVVVSLAGVLLAMPPLIAKLHGAGNREAIVQTLLQSQWVAILLGICTILLLHFPGPLIALSHLQPVLEIKVRAYLDVSAWGVPAVLAFRLFIGLLSGLARPRAIMVLNLTALMLKIPLNLLFMYGLCGLPALGATGCALSSTVSVWLIAFAGWYWCLNAPQFADLQLSLRPIRPDPSRIFGFLRLGLPIALTFIADLTAFTLMALFIARLGALASAAHQIAANLAIVAYMLPLSLGNATAVMVGRALGGDRPDLARHLSWQGLEFSVGIAAIISMLIISLAPALARLYTPDLSVQKAAIPLIMLAGGYHLADALQTVTVNALRGYQRTALPMVIYTIGLWGLGLGGGILLGLGTAHPLGARGFWMAAGISLGLVGGAMAAYLNRVSSHACRELDRH